MNTTWTAHHASGQFVARCTNCGANGAAWLIDSDEPCAQCAHHQPRPQTTPPVDRFITGRRNGMLVFGLDY
jgi:hypothetical protein